MSRAIVIDGTMYTRPLDFNETLRLIAEIKRDIAATLAIIGSLQKSLAHVRELIQSAIAEKNHYLDLFYRFLGEGGSNIVDHYQDLVLRACELVASRFKIEAEIEERIRDLREDAWKLFSDLQYQQERLTWLSRMD